MSIDDPRPEYAALEKLLKQDRPLTMTGCHPWIPLTEADVRRIVREEFGRLMQDEIEKCELSPTPEKERSA